MPTVFFTSDTHLCHENLIKVGQSKVPLRQFTSINEHDEFIIDNWNSVVRPSDLTWHLGDVVFGESSNLALLDRCNGRKKLIMGNHDRYPIAEYAKYFDEIYGIRRAYHGLVLSHVPIHRECLEYRWKGNIHGHIHNPDGYNLGDGYFNVCTDLHDFKPISLDEVRTKILPL